MVKLLLLVCKITALLGLLFPFYMLYTIFSMKDSLPQEEVFGVLFGIILVYVLFIGLLLFGKYALSLTPISAEHLAEIQHRRKANAEKLGLSEKEFSLALRYSFIILFAGIGILIAGISLLPSGTTFDEAGDIYPRVKILLATVVLALGLGSKYLSAAMVKMQRS